MKTILITAYAINPYKGSEDGTGWNIAKGIAKTNKAIVITRKNNREHIESYLNEFPDTTHKNMQFYYFDLPQWAMFWKKKIGERGYVLYFYLWQLFMPLFILKNKLKFDLAHNLNFHSDSHPTFLGLFGKPVIWGPIGHHPKTPKQFILPIYGRKAYLKDRLYYSVKWIMRNLDPFYRISVYNATKIIAINSSVQKVMNANPNKTTIIPAVASKPVTPISREGDDFTVLSVGRFVAMKGFDITIKAFAQFIANTPKNKRKNIKLKLVGKGEETDGLKKMVKDLKIEQHVEFVTWVNKEEMHNIYSQSDVFLFPSHEGAGMVVPEAMSYGLPVITFDNVGPGELQKNAGIKVSYASYPKAVNDFSQALLNLYNKPNFRLELSKKSSSVFNQNFTWEKKTEAILRLYNEVFENETSKFISQPIAS